MGIELTRSRTPTKSQLLTIPASVLPIFIILISTFLVDRYSVPSSLISLVYLAGLLSYYGVAFAYPNVGGVYTAMVIAGGLSNAWFPLVWPWRLQTTARATGSAFAIAFSNSLGGIGSIVGPQIFRQQYAPRYHVSFAVAMGFISACVLATLWTWWVIRKTERETRHLRTFRVAAAKVGETVLEDVHYNADFEKRDRAVRS